MAEEQALGTPSNHDACANCRLDSQPALAKPIISATADSPVSALCSSSSSTSVSATAISPTTAINKCVACRKRVGLTGFRCRCGLTYCGVHRYPENHGCDYDYKKEGREQIRMQNPVVVAEKLLKI